MKKPLHKGEVSMKKDNQNWLDWAMDIAREWKLQDDVKESFFKYRREGYDDKTCAEMALYDWDI